MSGWASSIACMRDQLAGDENLFQPDVVLPSQFFAAMAKRVPQEAEYELIIAVLQDAIECFQKHRFARDQRQRQLFEDARAWIASEDRDWPFSFENICMILKIDPGYVREGLMAWEEREGERYRAKVLPFTPPASPPVGERPDVTAEAS